MSSEYTLKITDEQAREMPMVDLAFLILKAANTPFYYRDLMQEVAKIKGIPEEEVLDVIAQLYTEINIDGRFACVGNNLWGLKRWYPLEKADDPMSASRPRIINDDDDDDIDEELFEDEQEYEGSDDEDVDYDAVDDEEEEEEFADEEVDEDMDEELEELDEELIDDEEEDQEEEEDLTFDEEED
ncbi:DNA-directed RNA polymerase subunit delta [Marinicrinis lubricantis]|uniref:Probable DNA-directed RNA polymerase subunit delta n=1 Tax=Marinicrinis lubricantis TaxID=2086470 RepID=A0ABW1IVD9_9BACL